MAVSTAPPWFKALLQQGTPIQGIQQRTTTLGTQKPSVSLEQIVRPKGRKGSRSKSSSDTPEGVIERLKDSGLSDAQIKRVTEGDKKDSFSPLSPGDWLGGAGDVLTGVLDKLDVPRAYTMSALVETSDALGAALEKLGVGNYAEPEQTDRFKQSGVSWRDFIENASNRVGFADILEADPRTEVNPAVAAASGLVFDIAADPLTYIGVGLAEDAGAVSRKLLSEEAINALGREGAERAAAKVTREGVNTLTKDELAAIGKEGGLYTRRPGSGAIGRKLGLNKLTAALADVPEAQRTLTLAAKGTKVGDAASELARVARKPVSGLLNAARLGERGLSGSFPKLRGMLREGTDRKFAEALMTLTKEPEARHVSKAFELDFMKRLSGLRELAEKSGVDGATIGRALGGDIAARKKVGPGLLGQFQKFLSDAVDTANELGGHFIEPQVKNYVPRILKDEALEKFGIRRQATRGVESVAKGRKYNVGDVVKIGKNKLKLVDPAADKFGRSVEEQIEGFLADNGAEEWFVKDFHEAGPEYVKRLSRQLKREYLGNELKKAGMAQDIYEPNLAVPPQSLVSKAGLQRIASGQRSFTAPISPQVTRQLDEAERIVTQLGAASDQAKSLDWEDLHAKAMSSGRDWEPAMKAVLPDTFKQWGVNTAMPDDIVGALRDIGKMSDPSGFQTVIKLHDRLLNGWKKMALFTPSYHWRNTFGGVYMNWLRGVDEGRYKQLEQLLMHDRRGTLAGAKIDQELKDAYEAAKKMGVFTGGQSIKEIENVNEGLRFNPVRGSRKLGGAIENRLRGALFIDDYVKNGGDATEALAATLKYHFDYENLGPAEAKIRQAAVPFYTFTRRAVPLMLEMIVRNPGKINRYFTIKRNVERLSPDQDIVPEYFERNFAIRLPWSGGGGGQRYLMPDLPLQSLVDVFDPNQSVSQLSPFVKTPLELWAGKQFFNQFPITDKGRPIPTTISIVPGLVPALRQLGYVKEDSEGKSVMTDRDVYLVSQFLPMVGQVRRLFPQEDKYEQRRMTSWLSYLFGLSLRTNTPTEQANELWRRNASYQAEQERQKGLGYDTEGARALAYNAP